MLKSLGLQPTHLDIKFSATNGGEKAVVRHEKQHREHLQFHNLPETKAGVTRQR
jgi:hypothetical protein